MKNLKHKIIHPGLLIISFFLMVLITGYSFFNKNRTYQRLRNEGIITNAKTTFIPKNYNADHYKLEFKTLDGRLITKVAKCTDEGTFNRDYSNLKVITDFHGKQLTVN